MSTGTNTENQNMAVSVESLILNGTAVTATAAEINAIAGGGLSGAELAVLDGVTAGTVTASKALVVDANKDLATIRHLTISGNLVTGSTTLSEAELGVLDAVTAGTVAASKALVVDANKGISGFRATAAVMPFTQGAANALNSTGTLTAAMMLGGIVTSTTGAGVTATLDTGSTLDTAYLALFANGAANDAFEFSVINTGGNSFTIATASGWTDGGNGFAAVAAGASACFRVRRTAANTFTIFKVG